MEALYNWKEIVLNLIGARLTVGYSENGFPVYYYLGYFEEDLDAILCLREYNNKPYNLYLDSNKYNKIAKFTKLPSKIILNNNNIQIIDKSNYTFKQVYEEYSNLYFPTKEEIAHEKLTHQKAKGKLSTDVMYIRMSAFKKSQKLHDIPYQNLRPIDFSQIINCEGKSPKMAQRLRNLYIELDNYAEQKDIISKSYAKFIKKVEISYERRNRNVFTNEEINLIWNSNDCLIKDILLILLYTGMRIEELLFLYTCNIHLQDDYIIGGLKTNNGKNRIIPLHHSIKPIIKKYYNKNNEFLFMYGTDRLTYPAYLKSFKEYAEKLNLPHTTHETRHTVESELDRRNANQVTKNLIMGHKNKGTGEDVYTHKSIQELKETIELLTYKETKLIYLNSCN